MRTLPSLFISKVLVLEDRSNLDKLTKDDLHGTLIVYEIRTGLENVSIKEATFKATRKPKNNRSECKNIFDMSNEEEANFVRKLKIGQIKYKGKLPLKCFKCGRIGHFDSKCTYVENKESENEEESHYQE